MVQRPNAVTLTPETQKYMQSYEETPLGSEGNLSASGEGEYVFKKVIRWLVYVAAFLLPLWFLPFTSEAIEFNKQVLLLVIACVGLVLFLIDVIRSGTLRYKSSLFYWPFLAMVVAGVFSVIFSVSRFASLFGLNTIKSFSLMTIAAFAVLFFLAVNTIEDKGKALRNILSGSVVLAMLFALLQSLGLFILRGDLEKQTSFNTIGSLNTIGILAAVALAFFATWNSSRRSSEESGKMKILLNAVQYLGFALSLFFVIAINWWVVWTVAFVSMLSLVAFNSANGISGSRGRMKLFAMPMAVIVIGIFLMLVNFDLTAIKSKFPVEVAPTFKTTTNLALESLKTRPLGFGLGNFSIAYDKLKPSSIANSVFYQVRFSTGSAQFLDMAVEGGILLVLAFLTLLWFYGQELVSNIKNTFFGNPEAGSLWAASLGMLIAFFLYPINMTLMAVMVLLLALLVVSKRSSHAEDVHVLNMESNAKYSFAGSVIFVVGLVLSLVAVYFTTNLYISSVYVKKALAATDNAKAIDYLVKSANSNNKDTNSYRLLSRAIVSQTADDLKNGPKKDESKENYNTRLQNQMSSAIDIAGRATTADPADSQNWFNRGFIFQNLINLVSGADQAAVNMYNESLMRNPADPVAYAKIGDTYLSVANVMDGALAQASKDTNAKVDTEAIKKQISDSLAKAEENYKKAIALYNDYGQALYNLAVVYDREGKIPDAVKQFEKLYLANQNDPSILFQLGLLYYRNNQKDNAFKAWQRAVVLFPSYSNARWYLSLLYEERGDIPNALAQVQEIAKVNPDNEQVNQRIAQLQSGKPAIPEKVLDQKPLGQ